MLEIRNLEAYYGNSRALQGINLKIETGKVMAVLGRNGVGKTTLFKAILGLMDRCGGEIALGGERLDHMPTHRRAYAGIGYVPQGRGIIPTFTVRENLKMGTFARAGNGQKTYDDLVFEIFPALREFLDRPGGNLSGGQQQQLAIGRALLTNPKIILLDEPTEGIQPNIVEQIEHAIMTLNRAHGITIVLVEQDIDFARRASDSFAIMEKGRVVAEGPIKSLTDSLMHKHMAV
ncbi:MAG: urea ABC transporter ATP-binding subunit UrtE [Parvibaculaceae bacterium]